MFFSIYLLLFFLDLGFYFTYLSIYLLIHLFIYCLIIYFIYFFITLLWLKYYSSCFLVSKR